LVYAGDINLLDDSINTIKENTETLLGASRDTGLEINAMKKKYMIISRHPNSGQDQNIRIANESFENLVKFKYLGTTLSDQNDIHYEIKSRLNSGNACYHLVLFVLYGCETWSLTLREEYRLRIFENRVLRRIFEPKREEDGSWRKMHNDELHILYSSPNIVIVVVGGTYGTYERGERCLQGIGW
jgi:hypothetical protein